MRAFLKFLIPCILLAGLLYMANYMDSGRYIPSPLKAPEEPILSGPASAAPAQTEQAPSGPPAIAAPVQTLPSDLLSVPEETLSAQTLPQETVPEETAPQETAEEPAIRDPNSIVITLLGDCTFGGTHDLTYAQLGFPKTVGTDYGYPFRNVLSYLESDDFTFLNLEGPLCDNANPVPGRFVFRGSEDYVHILTQNSVEAVSLSNNHTMDCGQKGYDATRRVLDEAGIPYAETAISRIITLDSGVTIGLYATMYGQRDQRDLADQIRALKEQGADLIIYVAHWGTEGSYRVTDEQRNLAYTAIDAGANIVYGSHPHVLQPIEEYKGAVIFYSMANFSFGGNSAPKDMDTALIQQELLRLEDGSYVLGQRTIVPCSVSSESKNNNYQPTPYDPGTAEYDRVMQKLNGTFTGRDLKIG